MHASGHILEWVRGWQSQATIEMCQFLSKVNLIFLSGRATEAESSHKQNETKKMSNKCDMETEDFVAVSLISPFNVLMNDRVKTLDI